MLTMRHKVMTACMTAMAMVSMNNANAVAYQLFTNLNYANPAALNSVKCWEATLGVLDWISNFEFSGTATSPTGVARSGHGTSHKSDFRPYGRIASRVHPKIVLGLDVTEPIWTNIYYPYNSVTQYFSTGTRLADFNVSPKLSYQVNEQLALGIGFDANFLYDAQLNFAVPPYGNLHNKWDSWAYGFDLGLFYTLTKCLLLNLSYYSKIVQHSNGDSLWGPISTHTSVDIYLPATWVANLIQLVTPKWALSYTLRVTEWDVLRYVNIQSSAIGNVPIKQNYFDNISAELATQYHIDDTWTVLGAVFYEPNPIPTVYRPVGLPAYTDWGLAIGGELQFNKQWKSKLIYAHGFANPPINSTTPAGNLRGNVDVDINVIDLSVTYSM